MKVYHKVFSYTTQSSKDKNDPTEMVLKELNETIEAEKIISIEKNSYTGEFRYDRDSLFDYSSIDRGNGHRPLTVTLTVFYRA